MEATGVSGKVTVDDIFVSISHEGSTGLNKFQNRLSQGYKGEKRIAIAQISAVQFKGVGGFGKGLSNFTNKTPGLAALNKLQGGTAGATGYIEFVIIGSSESKGRALLGGLNAMASNENAVTQPAQQVVAAAPDVASQIGSLKQLLDSGVLTEDEFQKAKAKILGI